MTLDEARSRLGVIHNNDSNLGDLSDLVDYLVMTIKERTPMRRPGEQSRDGGFTYIQWIEDQHAQYWEIREAVNGVEPR